MSEIYLKQLEEEHLRVTVGNFHKKLCKIQGYTLPEKFPDIQKKIEDFEVYDDDIWVTSSPKSGTTWCQEMVWCISRDLDYESAQEDLDTRSAFLEISSIFTPLDEESAKNYPMNKLHSVEFTQNLKRPRIIKTHLPWELLPRQIRTFQKRPKIIHVRRNMKDTCVSFYHHQQLSVGFTGDFDLFWKLFIHDKLIYTPMVDSILSYWQHREEPNLLLLRYEDMKADLRSVILRTCKFLNKSFSGKDVESLMEHLSLESMKNNRFVNKADAIKFWKSVGTFTNDNGSFIREGKVGGYKTEMSEEVNRIFEDHFNPKLMGTGLDLC